MLRIKAFVPKRKRKKERGIKSFKKNIFDVVFAYYNIHIIYHIVNVKAYQHNLRVDKLFLLALCPCNAQFNQNSYVKNYFINLLKINNKNK